MQSTTINIGEYIFDILDKFIESIVILDKTWRYVYLNEIGWRVLDRPKDEVLNTVVWELLPHMKGTEFEMAAKLAMKTQQRQEIQEYYPHRNETYQVRFYPSSEYLLIKIENISELIKAKEISEQLMGDLQSAMEVYWSEENKERREKIQAGNNQPN